MRVLGAQGRCAPSRLTCTSFRDAATQAARRWAGSKLTELAVIRRSVEAAGRRLDDHCERKCPRRVAVWRGHGDDARAARRRGGSVPRDRFRARRERRAARPTLALEDIAAVVTASFEAALRAHTSMALSNQSGPPKHQRQRRHAERSRSRGQQNWARGAAAADPPRAPPQRRDLTAQIAGRQHANR